MCRESAHLRPRQHRIAPPAPAIEALGLGPEAAGDPDAHNAGTWSLVCVKSGGMVAP
jgi:hypothetical protein